MSAYQIATIPVDGIGQEVLPAAVCEVVEAVCAPRGITLTFTTFDWSCDRYSREGSMMPSDRLAQLQAFDAIFLGAVGTTGVPDPVSLWGLFDPDSTWLP